MKLGITRTASLPPERRYKYFFHIVLWSVVVLILGIPTAGKMIDLFGTPTTVALFYFPLVYVFF